MTGILQAILSFFGVQASSSANYIEDVFSTYLYTGTGSSQTITNNIDTTTYGGLVWIKGRSGATGHRLTDTARGTTKSLASNSTDAEATESTGLTAFGTTGFTIGADADYNTNTATYASWTFREQAKFFDVVTYTGNGTAGRTIAHNLGSVPGCIIVKSTNSATIWAGYHRSLGATQYIRLNTTDAATTNSAIWNDTEPTSTVFTVGNHQGTNQNTLTYVAYLFAHDAGGFGLTGTDNVISCGSFTGAATVSLGYEPQWVLMKATSTTGNWMLVDNMRGLPVSGNPQELIANTSAAETSNGSININATGFVSNLSAGVTYIYIAIRRGPMRTPTSGTSVFVPIARTGTGAVATITGASKPIDLVIDAQRPHVTTGDTFAWDRLRGANNYLATNATSAENTSAGATTNSLTGFDVMDGFRVGADSIEAINGNTRTYINWAFSRAPGFFDVVCYTGTGVARTVNHNLGAVPELMIVKQRSGAVNWNVYAASEGNTKALVLNTDATPTTSSLFWNNTSPTSSVFTVNSANGTNASGATYVAYLFATVTGVSKVGSYTGTGTTSVKQVDCGFTGGARFVLIKRTDSTGDWYVWDTARGIVSGNDPYLLLNSTAAEVTTTDWVDTYSLGFELSTASGNNVNINNATYIFLAIA